MPNLLGASAAGRNAYAWHRITNQKTYQLVVSDCVTFKAGSVFQHVPAYPEPLLGVADMPSLGSDHTGQQPVGRSLVAAFSCKSCANARQENRDIGKAEKILNEDGGMHCLLYVLICYCFAGSLQYIAACLSASVLQDHNECP